MKTFGCRSSTATMREAVRCPRRARSPSSRSTAVELPITTKKVAIVALENGEAARHRDEEPLVARGILRPNLAAGDKARHAPVGLDNEPTNERGSIVDKTARERREHGGRNVAGCRR